MGKPTSKSGTPKVVESRYQRWLAGDVAPCTILGIDPGESAGAACLTYAGTGGHAVAFVRSVETNTLELERTFNDALDTAHELGQVLVLAIEDWGVGGPLGMKQWQGLGAAAGAWIRTAHLASVRCAEEKIRAGRFAVIARDRAVIRMVSRSWRSCMIEESGTYTERDGKSVFKPFDTVGWKRAATRRAHELFGHVGVNDSNAAEALLIAYCATRDERLAKLIPGGR